MTARDGTTTTAAVACRAPPTRARGRRAPTPTSTPTPRRAEQGATLVLVTVLAFLGLALFARAWRGTHDAIRTEAQIVVRTRFDETVGAALAAGVELLTTGRPPEDPWAARLTLTTAEGAVDVTLVYSSVGDPDLWDVQARPATDLELLTLDPLPGSF